MLLLLSLLAACGGEDITDFIDVSDLRLSQLEVVSGGSLLLNEEAVEEFDPSNIGPYRIDLDDENSESIQLAVDTELSSSNARIQLIEVQKADDDRNRVSSITPGESFNVALDQGANQIFVRVSSTSTAARLDYVININRISSSAALQNIEINNVLGSTGGNSNASYTPAFDSDVFEYDVVVGKNECGTEVAVQTESRFATVAINGEEVPWLDEQFIPLQAGEVEVVTVDVTAEDGSDTQTYIFRISKTAETVDERAADARLFSIALDGARETSEFRCSNSIVSFTFNQEDTAGLSLLPTFFDDQNGATLKIGEQDEDSLTLLMDEDTVETIVAGEAYTGGLLANLEEGSNLRLLEVVPANGNEGDKRTYQVVIVLSDTREIYVETAAELQTALLSAAANDEIILAEGDYLGVTAGSGNADAHFFSAQSGTAEAPIIVRAESGDVNLLGGDLAANTVFLLQGDYWEIENINFSYAQNGIVFDGASQVSLNRFEITEVGERGISVQNGAGDLAFDEGLINQTGLSPIDRTGDGIDEVYGEAVVVGDGVNASQNISISRVNFGRDIANESVDVKALADSVQISSSYFAFDNTLIRPVTGDRSLVLLGGGDTSLRYNEFDFTLIGTGSDELTQLVKSETAEGDTTIELEQNQLDLADQVIPFVNNAGSSDLTLIANERLDAGTISNVGSTNVADIPFYQIQSIIDPSQCITAIELGEDDRPSVELQLCDTVGEQLWAFLVTDSGFVQMVQTQTSIFSSAEPVFGLPGVPGTDVFYPFYIDNDESSARTGYLLQWFILREGDNAVFSNRVSSAAFLAEVKDVEDVASELVGDIVGADAGDDVELNFTLVRQ